ncbi:MAG: hypothetical protein ABIO70_00555 [Pseudomonadota bacterium]
MARAILPLLLAVAAFPPAVGAARIQWLEPELPPPEVRAQAERTTGPATHLDATEIAWPVVIDAHQAAQGAQAALRATVAEGRKRWETFDIERDLTWRLAEAVDELGLVESEQDREALYQALLLQGAAAWWAWPPGQRARLPEVKPLLVEVGGERLFAPWVDAVALFPDREPRRDDLPDQTTWQAFVHARDLVRAQRPAELTAAGLPPGASLYVDGVPVPGSALPLAVMPGRHWLHVEHSGLVSAVSAPRLGPGERFDLDGQVPADDLQRASEKALSGDLVEVPASVQHRVEVLRAETPDESYYLAAWSGRGAPVVWRIEGADAWRQGEFDHTLSLLLGAGVGGGIARSSAFKEAARGTAATAPDLLVDLNAELGWRRWGVRGGLAIENTTGDGTIRWGVVDADGDHVNRQTSTFLRLTAAPVFHVLRVRPRRPGFSLALPVGILTPAHGGVGVQALYDLPLGSTTWLRLGGDYWVGSLLQGYEPAEGVDGKLRLLTVEVGVCKKAL